MNIDPMQPQAGIYKFTCLINSKVYIGKSINLYKRINWHKNYSRNPKNKYIFHKAIMKYGWDSFNVEILEIFDNFDKSKDNQSLLEREAYYIEFFDSSNKSKGYNICKFSNDRTGVKCSDEHKRKISISNTGKIRSPETREKLRQINTGKTHSLETREKLRQINTGKTYSDEIRKRVSEAKKGQIFSKEHIENIRKSKLGTKHSEETKEKMRGRKLPEETKEKMRQSQLGRKHSEESKEKMRQAKKGDKNLSKNVK
jgi:group I intron endonuclease